MEHVCVFGKAHPVAVETRQNVVLLPTSHPKRQQTSRDRKWPFYIHLLSVQEEEPLIGPSLKYFNIHLLPLQYLSQGYFEIGKQSVTLQLRDGRSKHRAALVYWPAGTPITQPQEYKQASTGPHDDLLLEFWSFYSLYSRYIYNMITPI